jgi:hypothetical protein
MTALLGAGVAPLTLESSTAQASCVSEAKACTRERMKSARENLRTCLKTCPKSQNPTQCRNDCRVTWDPVLASVQDVCMYSVCGISCVGCNASTGECEPSCVGECAQCVDDDFGWYCRWDTDQCGPEPVDGCTIRPSTRHQTWGKAKRSRGKAKRQRVRAGVGNLPTPGITVCDPPSNPPPTTPPPTTPPPTTPPPTPCSHCNALAGEVCCGLDGQACCRGDCCGGRVCCFAGDNTVCCGGEKCCHQRDICTSCGGKTRCCAADDMWVKAGYCLDVNTGETIRDCF